jgi:hypothetical protein
MATIAFNDRAFFKRGMQAKLEVTYGTDPGSYTSTDSLLMVNPQHRIERDLVDRALVRPYFGGSAQLVASRRQVLTFSVELASSGTAGTAPAYGKLLQACSMTETLTASTKAVYTLTSSAQKSITIRYFIDGVMYKSAGARGTATLNLTAYERPMIDFEFWGYDTTATESDLNSTDYSAWIVPQIVSDANSGDISLGGTLSGITVSGGTTLVSRGVTLNIGNRLTHAKLLGAEQIGYNGREVTGSMSVGLSTADEVTWRTDINANTTTSLGFMHGSGTGNLVRVFCPKVQRVDPQTEEYEGKVLMRTELRALPSANNGNDELSLIFA